MYWVNERCIEGREIQLHSLGFKESTTHFQGSCNILGRLGTRPKGYKYLNIVLHKTNQERIEHKYIQ